MGKQAGIQKNVHKKLGYALNNMIIIPCGFASIVFVTGILLAYTIFLVINAFTTQAIFGTQGITPQSVFMNWGVSTLTHGGTPFTAFLRSFGTSFAPSISLNLSWMSEEPILVSVQLVINAVFFIFVPLLSVFIAMRVTRRYRDEKNLPVVIIFNSLWISVTGIISAAASQFDGFMLTDSTLITTGISYSFISAFCMTFFVSLFIQLIYAYRTGTDSTGSDGSYAAAIRNGITYGLRPVRLLLYVTPLIMIVWYILFLVSAAGYNRGISGLLGIQETALAIIAVIVCAAGLLIWVTCFIFGMPLVIRYDMPMDAISETIEISMFSVTTQTTHAATPLIAVMSITVLLVLLLMAFGAIRVRHSGKQYWISGAIALIIHVGLLMLLARYSAYSMDFNPSQEIAHILRLMSSEPNSLFFGIKSNISLTFCAAAVIYVFYGLQTDKNQILAKFNAALSKSGTQIFIGGTVLFVLAIFVSLRNIIDAVNTHFLSSRYSITDLISMPSYYVSDILFIIDNLW